MGLPRRLLRAPLIADAGEVLAAPGALLIEGNRVLAAGPPEAIGHVGAALVEEYPDQALLPALVNAHAHLDLSHIGPLPAPESFEQWLRQVIDLRREDAAGIAASVEQGIELSLAGGVAAVGDIAGAWSEVPLATLERSPLAGVSFIELFGQGSREAHAVERLNRLLEGLTQRGRGSWRTMRPSLQPHAPYSCGLALYSAAAASAGSLAAPLATHLAESPEEIEFSEHRTGPFADFLGRLGVLDGKEPAAGRHPLERLDEAGILSKARWLLVHLNCLHERHVTRLAALRPTVVYCPRASTTFGHPRSGWSPHRYRELMAAGVSVVLGTDSILCLDTPRRLSPLDDARLLWRRDSEDPRTLLRMMTSAAAEALGLPAAPFTLAPGEVAGVLAVTMEGAGLSGVMRACGPPRWLVAPGPPQRTG